MARDAGGGRDLRPAKPAINYAESDGSTATPETSPGKSSFDESFGSSNTSLGVYDADSSEDELQQSASAEEVEDDDDVIQGMP